MKNVFRIGIILIVCSLANIALAGSYEAAWDLTLPIPDYDPLWKTVQQQWRDHYKKKSVDELIITLENIKKIHPNKIEPYLWLGQVYYLKGKYNNNNNNNVYFKRSEEAIVKALSIDPKNIKAIKILSATLASYKTFDQVAAQYLQGGGKYSLVAPVGRALPELENSETWNQAIGYWDQRENIESAQKAVTLFKQIAAKEPKNALAKIWVTRGLYYLGYYYTSLDQHETGVPYYEEGNRYGLMALEHDSNSVPANYWRQLCLSRSIQQVSLFKKARNLKPIMDHLVFTANENPTYFYNGPVLSISTIIIEAGWVAEKGLAMAGYDMEAVKTGVFMGVIAYPTYFYSYLAKAQVLAHFGKKAQAKEILNKIIVMDPYINQYHAPENLCVQRLAKQFLAELE